MLFVFRAYTYIKQMDKPSQEKFKMCGEMEYKREYIAESNEIYLCY